MALRSNDMFIRNRCWNGLGTFVDSVSSQALPNIKRNSLVKSEWYIGEVGNNYEACTTLGLCSAG
jgi:hypothetical protein